MQEIIKKCVQYIAYQKLLTSLNSKLPLLEDFKFLGQQNVLKESVFVPSFFLKNFTHQERIIKHGYGQNSDLRGFFYIMLRYFTYEAQNGRPGIFLQFLDQVFSSDFIIDSNQKCSILSSSHMKILLAQWLIEYVDQRKNQFLLQSLKRYPVIDIILVSILFSFLNRSTLLSTKYSIRSLPSFQVLAKLIGLQYFQVNQSEKGYKLADFDAVYYSPDSSNVFVGFLQNYKKDCTSHLNYATRLSNSKNFPLQTIPEVVSFFDQTNSESFIPLVANSKFSEFQDILEQTLQIDSSKRISSYKKLENILRDSKENVPEEITGNLRTSGFQDVSNDFTSNFVLQFIDNPFKTNILNIKERVLRQRRGSFNNIF